MLPVAQDPKLGASLLFLNEIFQPKKVQGIERTPVFPPPSTCPHHPASVPSAQHVPPPPSSTVATTHFKFPPSSSRMNHTDVLKAPHASLSYPLFPQRQPHPEVVIDHSYEFFKRLLHVYVSLQVLWHHYASFQALCKYQHFLRILLPLDFPLKFTC